MSKLQDKLEDLVKASVEKSVSEIPRPFGLLLSGGVDSGLLAALSKPDMVFTCKFDYGPLFDEYDSARVTAEHLGLNMITVEPKKEDFLNFLPEALRAFRKTTHFSLVPLYMLFKTAKEHGITSVLSGEGPDEYLGGYTAYSIILHEQNLYKKKELKNYHEMLDRYLGSVQSRYARILNKKEEEIAPHWDVKKHLVSKMGYTDLQVRGIEEMELSLAKHWSVDLKYPYMTEEISDFCWNIRDSFKVKNFTTKHIWKKIAEKYLPKEVVWRKNKMGGPVAPISHWLGHPERPFDKEPYLKLQDEILGGYNPLGAE